MTERTKTRALLVVAVVLLLAVGAQGYQLFGLQKQLADITEDGSTMDGAAESSSPRSFQLAPPATQDPAFQNTPFDPGNWDPFQEMSRMQQHIDAMFNNAFGRFGQSSSFGPMVSEFTFSPKMDMQETDDEYILRLEIPGSDNSKINVNIENNLLTVAAETESGTAQDPNSKMLRQERHMGKFQRTITLPENADPESLKTNYEDGVYTITMKKTP